MSQIPTIEQNPNGLHQRYNVTKANGEPTDPMATYFVLRLDGMGRDHHHIQACRAAARAYVKAINDNPEATHLDTVTSQLTVLLANLESMGG